jgi:hypothetical protein
LIVEVEMLGCSVFVVLACTQVVLSCLEPPTFVNVRLIGV